MTSPDQIIQITRRQTEREVKERIKRQLAISIIEYSQESLAQMEDHINEVIDNA